MHPGTVAVIVFFVAFIGYSWLGILLVAPNIVIFNNLTGALLVVSVISVILALLTAAYVYKLESA